jgi:ribosomal protein L37E
MGGDLDLSAPTQGCGKTHAEHAAAWRSWRDDCDSCGYAQQDPEQCAAGHPDDGVDVCGACGHGQAAL